MKKEQGEQIKRNVNEISSVLSTQNIMKVYYTFLRNCKIIIINNCQNDPSNIRNHS